MGLFQFLIFYLKYARTFFSKYLSKLNSILTEERICVCVCVWGGGGGGGGGGGAESDQAIFTSSPRPPKEEENC